MIEACKLREVCALGRDALALVAGVGIAREYLRLIDLALVSGLTKAAKDRETMGKRDVNNVRICRH
jgi:hypothetical protein